MQTYKIERVGIADLEFDGDVIGQSAGAKPQVRIYRTNTSHYILTIAADAERARAQRFDKPIDLVNWLKAQLGSITIDAQSAIEAAAKNDDTFKTYWTERVE
ncbi:MAG TPA: hypothetical protein VFA90_17280 [Terriglobales bacterium]|nr:hypothetical protein [Terriglobales bacterium]